MDEQFRILHPIKYYRDHINNHIRPDGRELNKFRPVLVNIGSINTSDGSALAKVGDTTVICGIKAELCSPKVESPDQGFLIPNVELPPLCSSKFKPGPPSEEAQVVTQLLADIVKNSKCFDLKQLCICHEKLVWCLFADLICISYDGSLMDACVIALMGALKSVQLPLVDYDPAIDNKLVNEEQKNFVNIQGIPICTTFSMFDKNILYDPTQEEENLSSCTFNVVLMEDKLCSVHKPGGTPISEQNLMECIEVSKQRTNTICELIDIALKKNKT
ncbi:hypothetical protein WA026_009638 [Henosepilachna vigintioctopunctata]|uniref:Ribosomal RNA-processing protein 43 n=1 Tax=Henosepilachna vigintioctopunctata TaxID=420089 RepID=A0AAW1U7E8_9CUCU